MGNCQAIDNASLVIQHPNGRVDKLYCPVSAKEIMKMNPGHYVALLLTTTLYSSSATTNAASATTTTTTTAKNRSSADNNNFPVRITRIKLLRPTDNLALGHVYRLVTTQEVMKGLWAKKHEKMKKQQPELDERIVQRESSDFGAANRKSDMEKIKQVKQERHRSRHDTATNSGAAAKSRIWQPALQSISEAGS